MENFKPHLAGKVDFSKLVEGKEYWASPKVDACFSGGVMIWTDRGNIPIGDIVDNQMKVSVASFNERTRSIEFKPIIGWYNNGKKGISDWMGFSRRGYITKNHEVYDGSGWVRADSHEGPGFVVDPSLTSTLIGMLLGDGCAAFEKRHKENSQIHQWRLMLSVCEKDYEFGRKKVGLLSNWVSARERRSYGGYGTLQIGFTSSTCRSLPFDIGRFYNLDRASPDYGRRKKALSLKDLDGFDDLSLAIWYFDDGSLHFNNGNEATPRITICVARYCEETLKMFSRLFQTKYGVTPTIGLYGKDKVLAFSSIGTVYLLWRIGKAAGGLLPRKLIQGVPENMPETPGGLGPGRSRVGNPADGGKSLVAYDIEVEDNHNYFAEGQLVHNCRAVSVRGEILSRTLKKFPNRHVNTLYSLDEFKFFDGELVVGDVISPNVYLNSYSGIMKQDGEPEVTWCVFDYFKHPNDPYEARYRAMQDAIAALPDELALRLTLLVQEPVVGREAIEDMETTMLATGFEGLMLRDPTKPYKFGRSSNSEKDSALLKLKRMESGEARIVGFECEYENTNEATLDERGYTKRSTHKENKVPKDTLGRVFVKDVVSGVEFAIGVFRGLSKTDLKVLWDHRDDLLGKIVTYDYFGIGAYSAPRHPVMKGFRDKIDFGG